MIAVRLTDGLGNQLFQFSAGFALAQRHHTELLLDTHLIEAGNRKYGLGAFNIKSSVKEQGQVRSRSLTEKVRDRVFGKLMSGRQAEKPWYARRVVVQPHFHFDPDFFRASPHAELHGYWQSPKYFEGVEEALREQLSFSSAAPELDPALTKRLLEENSVALHVRRGDYVTDPAASQKYRLCEPNYYACGVALIRERAAGAPVYVFSDDLSWCRENLSGFGVTEFVDCGSDVGDFRAMTLCHHHVISNSTFAWWAAWLGYSPKQIVVAPQKWFKNHYDERDLFPPAWNLL